MNALPSSFAFGFEESHQTMSSYTLPGGHFGTAKAPLAARFSPATWQNADTNVIRQRLADWPKDADRAPRPTPAPIPEVHFHFFSSRCPSCAWTLRDAAACTALRSACTNVGVLTFQVTDPITFFGGDSSWKFAQTIHGQHVDGLSAGHAGELIAYGLSICQLTQLVACRRFDSVC